MDPGRTTGASHPHLPRIHRGQARHHGHRDPDKDPADGVQAHQDDHEDADVGEEGALRADTLAELCGIEAATQGAQGPRGVLIQEERGEEVDDHDDEEEEAVEEAEHRRIERHHLAGDGRAHRHGAADKRASDGPDDEHLTGNRKVDFFGVTQPALSLAERPVSLQDVTETGGGGEKSPWLAGALSLAVPGAGEVYTKNYLKGAIFFAAEAALS